MAFFNPFGLGALTDDPFSSSRGIFRQMDQMMGMGGMMQDPFANDPFFSGAMPAIGGIPRIQNPMMAMNPLQISPFGGLMGQMANIGNGNDCHVFSSSSVMTMSSGPDGRPQVYQSSSSSRGGPGGVRETQQSVVDSRRGVRKMAIGRHIGDRSHVVEKEMGATGDIEENEELVNLDEEELNTFNNEFKQRSHQTFGGRGPYSQQHRQVGFRNPERDVRNRASPYRPALPAPESGPSDHGRQNRKGGGGKSRSSYSR